MDYADLIADLRSTDGYLVPVHEVADVIEKLSAELTQITGAYHGACADLTEDETVINVWRNRTYRAENCIEQAPHAIGCKTFSANPNPPGQCTCWKADYKKAASDE